MHDVVTEAAWAYDDYRCPVPERIEIPGQHPDYPNGVKQEFALHEVVDGEGDLLTPESDVIEAANWEWDEYDIHDGDLLYVSGEHPEIGPVQQVFRLYLIREVGDGDIIWEN